MTAGGVTEIGLSRGPCFGTCPVFSVTLSRSGSYRYEGASYVEPLGERTGTVPAFLFDRLAAACVALGVLDLADVYPSHWDDLPASAVTFRHAGGVKVVRAEGGADVPPQYWAVAVLIEHVMREAFAFEDRKRRR